jgi:hypothetical protein
MCYVVVYLLTRNTTFINNTCSFLAFFNVYFNNISNLNASPYETMGALLTQAVKDAEICHTTDHCAYDGGHTGRKLWNTIQGVWKLVLREEDSATSYWNPDEADNGKKKFIKAMYTQFKKQKMICPITHGAMTLAAGPFQVSLDATEASKGHVNGNLRFVCWFVNGTQISATIADGYKTNHTYADHKKYCRK